MVPLKSEEGGGSRFADLGGSSSKSTHSQKNFQSQKNFEVFTHSLIVRSAEDYIESQIQLNLNCLERFHLFKRVLNECEECADAAISRIARFALSSDARFQLAKEMATTKRRFSEGFVKTSSLLPLLKGLHSRGDCQNLGNSRDEDSGAEDSKFLKLNTTQIHAIDQYFAKTDLLALAISIQAISIHKNFHPVHVKLQSTDHIVNLLELAIENFVFESGNFHLLQNLMKSTLKLPEQSRYLVLKKFINSFGNRLDWDIATFEEYEFETAHYYNDLVRLPLAVFFEKAVCAKNQALILPSIKFDPHGWREFARFIKEFLVGDRDTDVYDLLEIGMQMLKERAPEELHGFIETTIHLIGQEKESLKRKEALIVYLCGMAAFLNRYSPKVILEEAALITKIIGLTDSELRAKLMDYLFWVYKLESRKYLWNDAKMTVATPEGKLPLLILLTWDCSLKELQNAVKEMEKTFLTASNHEENILIKFLMQLVYENTYHEKCLHLLNLLFNEDASQKDPARKEAIQEERLEDAMALLDLFSLKTVKYGSLKKRADIKQKIASMFRKQLSLSTPDISSMESHFAIAKEFPSVSIFVPYLREGIWDKNISSAVTCVRHNIPKGYEEVYEELLQTILARKNRTAKEGLIAWVMLLIGSNKDQLISPEEMRLNLPLLLELAVLSDASLRKKILLSHFTLYQHPETKWLEQWRHYRKHAEKSGMRLPAFLLAHLGSISNSNTIFNALYKDKNSIKEKNSRLSLIRLLHLFVERQDEQSLRLLETLFNPDFFSARERADSYRYLYDIFLFSQENNCLSHIKSFKELSLNFSTRFQEIFGLQHNENFLTLYKNSFAAFRKKEALLTYRNTLAQLEDPMRGTVLDILKLYVESVLEGNFKKVRYDIHRSRHLKTLFEYDPLLYQQWKRGHTFHIDELSGIEIPAKWPQKEIKKILKEKILSNHLGAEWERDYKHLFSALTDPNPQRFEENLKLIEVQVTECQNALLKQTALLEANKNDAKAKSVRKLIGERLKRLSLETILSELLLTDKPCGENILDKLLAVSPTKSLFARDLKQLIKDLKAIVTPHEVTLMDTDDPCDLLLIGTEVEGSCQSVDSNPRVSSCLLAYLLDGKIRAMAVKSKDGTILARCMIRLLWDMDLQRPVMYQEPIYTAPRSSHANLLQRAIELRASMLNLPLVSIEETAHPYDNPIHSLGGISPFEYIDALGNRNENSNQYELFETYYI